MGAARSVLAELVRGTATGPDARFAEIHGSSPAIRTLKSHMLRVADDRFVTTLIVGESGTGKERIARAIHDASPRRHAPFVVVDCAGLSPTLAEDALFGHVRGAFTGAIDERAGPFEGADGGTVLLDEIGDLPADLQMKLLRALQSRTVQRLGARQAIAFDARIIAATNVDLAAARSRGDFREDLYYRLRVYEIRVPPLRRRGAADIRALAAAIVARLAERRGRRAPPIDPEALDALVGHGWPGNVRELENVLERMLVAAGGDALGLRHLPDDFGGEGLGRAERPRRAPPEREQVVEALGATGFRFGRTAGDLGLSRHQLYRLVRRYGIRPPVDP